MPREHWHTVILGAHPGYISWADYEENLAGLHENAQANGADAPRAHRAKGRRFYRAWRLRALRRADDRPLPRRHGQAGARVPLPEAGHRERRTAMPEIAGGTSTAPSATCSSPRDAARLGSGAGGARRARGPGRRRPTTCATSKSSGHVTRPSSPNAATSRRPRQPPGRPVARSRMGPQSARPRDAQDDYERRREADGRPSSPTPASSAGPGRRFPPDLG